MSTPVPTRRSRRPRRPRGLADETRQILADPYAEELLRHAARLREQLANEEADLGEGWTA
jgi:hypothetical protein